MPQSGNPLRLPIHAGSAPSWAWEAFQQQLTELRPGVVACTRWSLDYAFGDTFDPDDESALARLAVVVRLLPSVPALLEELADDCGQDEAEEAADPCFPRTVLSALDALIGQPRANTPIEPAAQVGWEVGGAGMGWAGSVEMWPIEDGWMLLTTSYDRETWGDRIPIPLGFAKSETLPSGGTEVIKATVGRIVGAPGRIWWEGVSGLDALAMAMGLGQWDPPLDLKDKALKKHVAGGRDQYLSIAALRSAPSAPPVDPKPSRAAQKPLEPLTPKPAEVAHLQATPDQVMGDRPIDALVGSEIAALRSWFEAMRGERLVALRWQPNGIKYLTHTPVAVLSYDENDPPSRVRGSRLGGRHEVIPFPGATSAPLLGDLLDRLPPPAGTGNDDHR